MAEIGSTANAWISLNPAPDRVIPAVCSHNWGRLIRFDNQKMTAVLTLHYLFGKYVSRGRRVEIAIAGKSLKICSGFFFCGRLRQKGFVGVYQAVQKPQRSTESQSRPLCLAWVGPTWQLPGCRDFHYDAAARKKACENKRANLHLCAERCLFPSLKVISFIYIYESRYISQLETRLWRTTTRYSTASRISDDFSDFFFYKLMNKIIKPWNERRLGK